MAKENRQRGGLLGVFLEEEKTRVTIGIIRRKWDIKKITTDGGQGEERHKGRSSCLRPGKGGEMIKNSQELRWYLTKQSTPQLQINVD